MSFESSPLVLTPARSWFTVGGWFGAAVSLIGFAVAVAFAGPKRSGFEFFVGLAVLTGALMFFATRYSLKRVVPAPADAVVVDRSIAPQLAFTGVITAALVALALVEGSSGAILGIGFGGSLASTWAGRKLREFERDDGRRVLRRVQRGRRGEPYLFVEP